MSARKLATLAIILWLATIVVIAFLFVRGQTRIAPDGRKTVLVQDQERNLILTEMRGLLSSVQGIVGGLSKNDRTLVAESARHSGMAAAVDVSPALMAKLPLEFKQLGLSVHHAFDDIDRAVSQGESNAQILVRLDQQLQRCVACHAAYRLPAGKP